MENGLTQGFVDQVVAYIAEHPKCSASAIPGDKALVLLALRQLNRSGRIKGIIQADPTKIGNDKEGPYIADAVGLELT
jgi:hypothetical protein